MDFDPTEFAHLPEDEQAEIAKICEKASYWVAIWGTEKQLLGLQEEIACSLVKKGNPEAISPVYMGLVWGKSNGNIVAERHDGSFYELRHVEGTDWQAQIVGGDRDAPEKIDYTFDGYTSLRECMSYCEMRDHFEAAKRVVDGLEPK